MPRAKLRGMSRPQSQPLLSLTHTQKPEFLRLQTTSPLLKKIEICALECTLGSHSMVSSEESYRNAEKCQEMSVKVNLATDRRKTREEQDRRSVSLKGKAVGFLNGEM